MGATRRIIYHVIVGKEAENRTKMAYGVCKLTGNSGQFVESHLIPKALSRPTVAGKYFISGGQGKPPKKSWSSWYDQGLVIRKGESILSDYDNWAIHELRRLELIWSGWSAKSSLPVETWFGSRPEGFGLRQVECANPDKLRLFFLSLLWRAAATTRPEFREVILDPDAMELLRTMVRDGNPRPLDFYPTMLVQIVSRGDTHNFGPISRDYAGKYEELDVDIRAYRFYFDGLVAIMCRSINLRFEGLAPLIVGHSPSLSVQTIVWERCFQLNNMMRHRLENIVNWPEQIRKLARIGPERDTEAKKPRQREPGFHQRTTGLGG
jgi:hypothetical protein